ncbi:MAG: secretin N-terminal domain-containing protein, partial [Pirellulales bacterium]
MTLRVLRTTCGLLCAWLLAFGPAMHVSAQEDAATAESPAASPAGKANRRSERRRNRAGKPQGAEASAKKQDDKGAAKEAVDAKAADDKKPAGEKPDEAGPPPIVRSDQPDEDTKAEPVPLKPDADGRMAFQFRGQKWPAVLEWLADWSHMSLDWQELPGDYLNLTTRRKYTAREARDLINRHLLARGYTMLIQGEVLSIVSIKKLDPAMVPRVAPDQLGDRDSHEFVKVSFPLDWLLASSAAEELKPMLSPNGKLTALATTNRLEAMDSVANLRQIARVLDDEQSSEGQQLLVRKFVLHHTRASEVREQLMALLGIESKQASQPMTPQQMQQQQQMAQMRAQQKKKGAAPAKEKPKIYLVAVPRENVILANAPPDKMALIDEAIRAIDVDVDRGSAYRRSVERMNIYRLTTIDPEALVKTLEEIGSLDFNTRLEVDKQNRAIIAYASLADHLTIRALIQKLDGSARDFHVVRLRRLEAEFVAGTIQFMMGGKEEKKPQRRRGYYSFFQPSRRSEEPTPQDQFSVDADIVNNRLLLRANEDEIRQVEDLLIKLGEIPSRTGDPSTVRLIEAPRGPSTEAWLERIRRTWNGPNRLEIDLPETAPAETAPANGKP